MHVKEREGTKGKREVTIDQA
uniref:Uncharacterized protein n=1 Tax=Arundo donax TaxID=35708 RepID=A0A0A8Y413_ARUDO